MDEQPPRRSNRPKVHTHAASQYNEARNAVDAQRQSVARRKFINAQKKTQAENTPSTTEHNESDEDNLTAPSKRTGARKNIIRSSPPPAAQNTNMNKDDTWVGVRMEEVKRDHMILFLSQRDNRTDLGTWDNEELEALLGNNPNWKEPNYNKLLNLGDGQAQPATGASEEQAPGFARDRYRYVQSLGTTSAPDAPHTDRSVAASNAAAKRPQNAANPINPNKRPRLSSIAGSTGHPSQRASPNTTSAHHAKSNSQSASQVVPRPLPAPQPPTPQVAPGHEIAPPSKQPGPVPHSRAPNQLRPSSSSQVPPSVQPVGAPSGATNRTRVPTSSQAPLPGSEPQKRVPTRNNTPSQVNDTLSQANKPSSRANNVSFQVQGRPSQLPPGRPLDIPGRPTSNNPTPRPSPQPTMTASTCVHPGQPPVRTGLAPQTSAPRGVPAPPRGQPPRPPGTALAGRQPAASSNPPGQAHGRNTPPVGALAPGHQTNPHPPTAHRRFLSAFLASRDSASRSPTPSIGPSDTESVTNSAVGHMVTRKRKAKPRPKGADYNGTEKDILERGAHIYKARMVAYGMYEADHDLVTTRMLDAWEDACDYYGVKSSDYPMTSAHQKCFKARLTSYCGRMRDRIMHEIPKIYELMNLTKEELEQTADDLCPNGLHTKPGSRRNAGQFQHPAIQKATDRFLFNKKDDLGIEFNQCFNPMPLEAIAFFCTIIEAVLKGTKKGKFEKLNTAKQRLVYVVHLANVNTFSIKAPDRCKLVQEQLQDRAFAQSGAVLPPVPKANPDHLLAEDEIEPDPPSEHELTEWPHELGQLSSKAGFGGAELIEGFGAFGAAAIDEEFDALREEGAAAPADVQTDYDDLGDGGVGAGWAGQSQYEPGWGDAQGDDGDGARAWGEDTGGGNAYYEGDGNREDEDGDEDWYAGAQEAGEGDDDVYEDWQ